MPGVDLAQAHLSDTLFLAAVATYAVAMVAFTAEYAFGRRGRVRAATSALASARTRALVGAGGPDVVEPAGPAPAPPRADSPPRRDFAERVGQFGFAALALGALFHIASLAVRAIAVAAWPWSDMYEFASALALVAVLAFVTVLHRMPKLRYLGGVVLLPVIVLMFLAGTAWYSPAEPLVPALQSFWLAVHVTLVCIGEGAMMTSAVFTALYLVKSRVMVAAAAPGYRPGPAGVLAARLPGTDVLDKAAYRIAAFAFPLFTAGVICGAIWAEAAWGKFWGWDPKETWALITWIIYACYLHARATAGWKGRRAAWFNLAGFGAIMFNLVIVNVVISGLHSYAGLS